MTDWFRSWHGAPTDAKWLTIARRAGVPVAVVPSIAWALLDYASQHEERGCVEGFDTEAYADWSGLDETQVVAVIDAMTAKGILVADRWANWGKRQPQREDNSTDRVRNYRNAKRSQPDADGTPAQDALPSERNAVKRDVTHGNATQRLETLDKSREDTEYPPVAPPAPVDEPSTSVPVDEAVVEPVPLPSRNETWALIVDVFAVTGMDASEMTRPERNKQGAVARRLLRASSADDIVTCARWLWSQPFHRDRGIDLLLIESQLTRWKTLGKPREAPPQRSGTGGPVRPVPAYYRDFPDDLHGKESA